MSLNPELSQFIGHPYTNYSPQFCVESNTGDCRFWLHKFYQTRFGVTLPLGLWSEELFHDQKLFKDIPATTILHEGDVFMFGKNHQTQIDPRKLHVAYFTGETNLHNQPLLLHATQYENQVTVWPLPVFFTKPRYEQLIKIKRLKSEFWEPLVKPMIS